MKKIFGMILCVMFSTMALAANEVKIAIVNVNELYNKSSFVQTANKNLQEEVKSMEEKLQAKRNKLQTLIENYQKNPSAKKKEMTQQIASEQTQLTKMTQEYQKNIQEKQNSGLQRFTQLVQTAVAKIAKEKQINTVLNSTAVVYTDNSWLDITNEVQTAMQQN